MQYPLIGLEPHLDADPIPQRRQPRVVDLQLKSSRDDRLVLGLQRVGQREHELFLCPVVLVRPADLDACRRGRRQKRVFGRMSVERVAQCVDFPLERVMAHILDWAAAQQRHPARRRLIRNRARLLEQRAARQRLVVEVRELRPVLAGRQHGAHGGGVGRLESRQARVDERDEVAALGQLAFVDEVDARVALFSNDVSDCDAQPVVRHGVLRTLHRAWQRSDVRREDPVCAASHVMRPSGIRYTTCNECVNEGVSHCFWPFT